MKFGFAIPQSGVYPSLHAIKTLTLEGERLAYNHVYVADHIPYGKDHLRNIWLSGFREQINENTPPIYYDAIATLSYLAGVTESIKLMTAALVLPVRNMLLTGRELISLQELSNDRLIAGVCLGDYPGDFRAMEVPYNERGARFGESLEVLTKILRGGTVSHHGKYYNFDGADFYPAPKHIPIYIGGGTILKDTPQDKDLIVPKSLDRVARFADGWFPSGPPAIIREGRGWLDAKLPDYGRAKGSLSTWIIGFACIADTDEKAVNLMKQTLTWTQRFKESFRTFEKNLTIGFVGSGATLTKRFEEYAAAGVDGICMSLRAPNLDSHMASLRKFAAEVMPSFT